MPPSVEGPQVEYAQGLRVVYVNFDGVTLTNSSSADDATTNRSAMPFAAGNNNIPVGSQFTIPQFQPNQLGNDFGLSRAQIITRTITRSTPATLPTNVEFVTEASLIGHLQHGRGRLEL